jgi:tetratricopeptide (TPR) repeat protein
MSDAPVADLLTTRYREALLAHQRGDLAQALDGYQAVVAQAPDHADAWFLLGQARQAQGDFPAAEAALKAACKLRPVPQFLCSLGRLLQATGQAVLAEAYFRNALGQAPADPAAYECLAALYQAQGQEDKAAVVLRELLALNPDHAAAYNDLGGILFRQGRTGEALTAYRQACQLHPDCAEFHYNLANTLRAQGQFDLAEGGYLQALALAPKLEQTDILFNMAKMLEEARRPTEAESIYRRVVQQVPAFFEAQWNLALLLLRQGKYEEGWRYYDCRHHPDWSKGQVFRPAWSFPEWQGQPLAGKTLLLQAEQGWGDMVQFIRYAEVLKGMGGARLSFCGDRRLHDLFRTNLHLDVLYGPDEIVPSHDYWALPMSLPRWCRTTLNNIPAALPYLASLPERRAYWQPRLPNTGQQGDLRVGLVWQGNPDHENDAHRSLPGLAALAPLWSVPGVAFVSLQVGEGEAEALAAPSEQTLTALGQDFQDFADTAAVVDQLDLLISVDTATAHVAAALGRPCWLLIAKGKFDWRWLQERSDSPWYPSVMHLFRQTTAGDWTEPVARIQADLNRMVMEHAIR